MGTDEDPWERELYEDNERERQRLKELKEYKELRLKLKKEAYEEAKKTMAPRIRKRRMNDRNRT